MGSSRQKTYKIFFGILGCFIFIYALIQVYPILRGPQIFVEGINQGENHGPVAFISGKTSRVKELTLNNNKILLDEEGNWSDTLLLHEGYNVLSIVATDNFGRTKIEKFEITADKFAFVDQKENTKDNGEEIPTVLGANTEEEYKNLQGNEEL